MRLLHHQYCFFQLIYFFVQLIDESYSLERKSFSVTFLVCKKKRSWTCSFFPVPVSSLINLNILKDTVAHSIIVDNVCFHSSAWNWSRIPSHGDEWKVITKSPKKIGGIRLLVGFKLQPKHRRGANLELDVAHLGPIWLKTPLSRKIRRILSPDTSALLASCVVILKMMWRTIT